MYEPVVSDCLCIMYEYIMYEYTHMYEYMYIMYEYIRMHGPHSMLRVTIRPRGGGGGLAR